MPEIFKFQATEGEISPYYQFDMWSQIKTQGLPKLRSPEDVALLLQTHNYQTFAVTHNPHLPDIYFYAPEGTFDDDQIEELTGMAERVGALIGQYPACFLPVHTCVLPDKSYMPSLGKCEGSGTGILMRADNKRPGNTWTHELAHAWLNQTYGMSVSTVLAEGAAGWFTYQAIPSWDTHYSRHHGYEDIIRTALKPGTVPLSHTEMLDEGNVLFENAPEVYEHAYSYGFGGLFVEFLVQEFGKEKFLEVYARNCWSEFPSVSPQERDIVAWALREAGLDPYKVAKEFQNYLREEQKWWKPFKRFLAETNRNLV